MPCVMEQVCKHNSGPGRVLFVSSQYVLHVSAPPSVRVWWLAPIAARPFPSLLLRRMSWWVRIRGCCCLVLGSPDGLCSRAQQATSILKSGLSECSLWLTSMTVKCPREKRASVFIETGKAAGQRLKHAAVSWFFFSRVCGQQDTTRVESSFLNNSG